MRYVRIGTGDEVIEAQNLPPFFDEDVAKMRSEKSRTACDYRSQLSSPLSMDLALVAPRPL